MGYFPMFMQMTGRKVLVVGGGAIAAEKLEKLVAFTDEITVIAEAFSPEAMRLVEDYGLVSHKRRYETGDIEGFDIVIVATDTVSLHKAIYEESRAYRIWVNSVDNTAYCDFIFPSFVRRGDLTVAFSTGGASPAFAKKIRRHFETLLPEGIEDFLSHMKRLRSELPKGKARMKRFEEMVERYFRENFYKS